MIHRSACLRRQLFQSFGSFKLAISSSYATASVPSEQQVLEPSTLRQDEYADVDWDNLGFSLMPTDYMYTMTCPRDGHFQQGQLSRYGNICLNPASGVLNYGQGIFEGIKAYRKEDGNILIFRPDQNAIRMKIGAQRMCMPFPSIDQFVDALKQTTLANKRWVPPSGKGTLYIRPLLLGTGAVLGLAPAPEFTFLVYASPVGNYFKEGSAPLNLLVAEECHRASPGGTGSVKTISNYAPALKALTRAKSKGFSDVLYLDSVNNKNVEEVSTCNIFIVKNRAQSNLIEGDLRESKSVEHLHQFPLDGTISTPATNGTILSGVTRSSIIEIARDYGYKVEERVVPIDELMNADEVFCTGTAVVVASVGTVTYQSKRVKFKTGGQSVSQELYSALVGIQMGVIEDKKGWTVELHS